MPDYIIPIHINKQKVYKNKYIYIYVYVMKFRSESACMLLSNGSSQACQSPMGLRSGMLDSNAWIGHVGLQSGMSVSDKACQSSIKHDSLQ